MNDYPCFSETSFKRMNLTSGGNGLAGAEQMDRADQEIEAEHYNHLMKIAYENNDHEMARRIRKEFGDNANSQG